MKKFKKCRIIVLVIIFLSLLSYWKFGSINFPKVAWAIVQVNTTDTEYVVVKGGAKKVIIARGDTLKKYATSTGYKVVDQVGSLYTIEKDGEKESVLVSGRSYCSLWRWD